jgi:hypothetical protein
MGLFHHITVFPITDLEKASFLEAGVAFTDITRGPAKRVRGEERQRSFRRLLIIVVSF